MLDNDALNELTLDAYMLSHLISKAMTTVEDDDLDICAIGHFCHKLHDCTKEIRNLF